MDLKQQFQYCSFCKISHKQKKKHVYSKKHQQIIIRILQKFSEKVKSAKSTLQAPDIQDTGYEHGAKFWCYFCVNDYNKHLLLDVCTLKYGGLLQHISEDTHRSSVYSFLQQHRLDEEKQPASQFLLSQDILKRYKQSAEIAIRRYEERKKSSLKKEAVNIEREENRRLMLDAVFTEELQIEKPSNDIVTSHKSHCHSNIPRKTTLSAHGEGLTFIGTQSLSENEGNVHTDAPPPWLQTEEDEHVRSDIGPSMEDYNKHLKREKSKKLPPGRVGAKFDRTGSTSSQWLPSFGRVWNTGRRQQSEVFFRKEMSHSDRKYDVSVDQSEERPSTSSSSMTSSIQIKPYVRKKRTPQTFADNQIDIKFVKTADQPTNTSQRDYHFTSGSAINNLSYYGQRPSPQTVNQSMHNSNGVNNVYGGNSHNTTNTLGGNNQYSTDHTNGYTQANGYNQTNGY